MHRAGDRDQRLDGVALRIDVVPTRRHHADLGPEYRNLGSDEADAAHQRQIAGGRMVGEICPMLSVIAAASDLTAS
jgi:hypothetical protein